MEKLLKERTDAEVFFDAIHRLAYSVDASIYEIVPLGIVIPKTIEDLIETVKIAKDYGVPLIPRGAATGITGGCLGKGLIIDTSKYLNRILEVNLEEEYAICEPGVIQDDLNALLHPNGYRLGPDTSTGNRATLGGMVANNAAGSHSLLYGTMADHTKAVDLLLSSGNILHCENLNPEALKEKCLSDKEEGKIYREILNIRDTYREEIKKRFPNIPRSTSGYNLLELIKDESLNLSKLVTGSEGSLGIVTRIKVSISKKSKFVGLCVIHYNNMLIGMQSISKILQFHPIALEMIDNIIIDMARRSPVVKNMLGWITGSPQMVFAAEFDGATEDEVSHKLQNFKKEMSKQGIGYAHVLLQSPEEMKSVWEVRKAGLGLLLSKRSYSRAIAFIEDFSVAPENLPGFMEKFDFYLKSIGKEAGIYGHVGSGCMHVRPYIDLRKKEELNLLKKIQEDITDLLIEHHGVLSGEHGDGIIRSWLNPRLFGEKIAQAFQEIKAVFDPINLMNPRKIVNGLPVLDNLRIDPNTPIVQIPTFMDFSREGGFDLAVDLCNGNGQCRKKTQVMCPSFQASGNEYDTTRARAQALRGVIHNRLPATEWAGDQLHAVLDLCIQCKGCKKECPSQVDMAKMKSEFLYHYQEKNGYSIRTRMIGHLGSFYSFAARFSSLSNLFIKSSFIKWVLGFFGFSENRQLPLLASQRFSEWFKTITQSAATKQVVLFNDTYTEFVCPEVGKSAVKVLNALGYSVIVPEWTCCGRPQISKGMLKQARRKGDNLIDQLHPYIEQGLSVVGLEPSCILTLKDELVDLTSNGKEKVSALSKASFTFDEFVNQHLVNGKLPFDCKEVNKTAYLHGHCHQKALVGTTPTLNVLKAIPGLQVKEIPSGCCGMAGSFGYEKEHEAFSLSIGELQLLPAVRSMSENDILIADGFSCRSQIIHGTQRHPLHLAELLADVINNASA